MPENELEARLIRKVDAASFSGQIVLIPVGQSVPSGWLLCTGIGGTPNINSLAPTGTKYIMKS